MVNCVWCMRLLVIFLIWAPVACVFAADAAAGTGAVSRAGLEDEDLALFFEQRLSQIGALLEAAGDLAGLEPDRAERALAKALEMTIETIGRIRENITSGVIRDRNHWASQSPGTAWDPAGYLTETTGLPSLMARMVKVWLKMNPARRRRGYSPVAGVGRGGQEFGRVSVFYP